MSLKDILQAQGAYKSYESEGFLDIWLYRPAGALLALAGARLGLTPNMLTVASLLTGVGGSAMLFPDAWMWHGVALIVLGGIFDASDGQLARMTGSASLFGRILDGASDYFVIIATYLALAFKYLAMRPDASSVPIFTLAAAAGVSHSLQASLFDYYRSEYTEYVDKKRVPVSDLDKEEARTGPEEGPVKRFLAWSHKDYTLRQRKLASGHVRLGESLRAARPEGKLDEEDAAAYRELNLPVIKLWNIQGTNSRLLVMIAALAAGRPEAYFIAEVVGYNALALLSHFLQSRADRGFRSRRLKSHPSP